MAGFNSPNIMFLNTYDAPDRKFIQELVPKLVSSGYDRYVELYCGAFVMPLIVAGAGVKPKDIWCYDVSLFSNILGYLFSGQDLNELEVKKNGVLIEMTGKDDVENASILLYEQALARIEKATHIDYFRFIVRDMEENRQKYIDSIYERLKQMDATLHGLHFERLYIWEAYEKEKDSSDTFIVSNPPTYKGAYEKFFDTGGVIEWVGDSYGYEIWDGSVHCPQIMNEAEDAEALLLLLQQANKGNAATENPVSARFLSMTQNVYWNTNKPEVIESLNGQKELGANGAVRRKSKYDILPYDYEITENSKVEIFVEDGQVAEYYRRIWAHRITGKTVSVHLCVLVDGMIAGMVGLDFNAIIKPYRKTDKNTIIMSYAFPAPNETCRLARLLVGLIKSKKILIDCLSASVKNTQSVFYVTIADSVCTVEYTKYPEIKGLRGLMKIEKKEKKSDNLFALSYYADLNSKSKEDVLKDFVIKERKYKKCRKN